MNELFFGADLARKGAGEAADSLNLFVWEASTIRRGFSTGSLLFRYCCSQVLLMSWSWFVIDNK